MSAYEFSPRRKVVLLAWNSLLCSLRYHSKKCINGIILRDEHCVVPPDGMPPRLLGVARVGLVVGLLVIHPSLGVCQSKLKVLSLPYQS